MQGVPPEVTTFWNLVDKGGTLALAIVVLGLIIWGRLITLAHFKTVEKHYEDVRNIATKAVDEIGRLTRAFEESNRQHEEITQDIHTIIQRTQENYHTVMQAANTIVQKIQDNSQTLTRLYESVTRK